MTLVSLRKIQIHVISSFTTKPRVSRQAIKTQK